VLGDNELDCGVAKIKNMKNGEEREVKLADLDKNTIEELTK
jgi:histidyl-tRNA synthetase